MLSILNLQNIIAKGNIPLQIRVFELQKLKRNNNTTKPCKHIGGGGNRTLDFWPRSLMRYLSANAPTERIDCRQATKLKQRHAMHQNTLTLFSNAPIFNLTLYG